MKKALLVMIAAALMAAVFTGCENGQLSGDVGVISKDGGASGIDAESIQAADLPGGVLVQWRSVEDAADYLVFRREYNAEEEDFDDQYLKQMTGGEGNVVSYSSIKKIPYFWDTSVKNGVKYQYGIVTKGYHQNTVSEIVWQEETDTSTFVSPTKKYEAPTAVSLPATPSAVITKIDNIKPQAGVNNFIDELSIEVSGIVPGFNYSFELQQTTATTAYEEDWNQVSTGQSNYSPSFGLDGETTAKFTWQVNPTSVNTKYRLIVTITGASNTYIVVQKGVSANQYVNPVVHETRDSNVQVVTGGEPFAALL